MSRHQTQAETYLPAAGHDWALPLYDPIVRLLGADRARQLLLTQAELRSGHRVLDIGCGTGTLATTIKRFYPEVEVTALDPDPKALLRAQWKAERSAVTVRFDQASSDRLPYPESSFDRVFSSYMFHHLQTDQRENTLREVRRVLVPGGRLHLLDFDRPEEARPGGLMRLLHSDGHLKDNSERRILALMRQAGFETAERVQGGTMLLGLLRFGYYVAQAPSPANPARA